MFPFIIIYILFNCSSSVYADSPEAWQTGFQDPASPAMQGIVDLHHDLWFFLLIVTGFVFWLLFQITVLFDSKNKLIVHTINYGTTIEVVWTIIPGIILLFVAIPSFTLLYSMDELVDPMLTLKVIGSQWFWSYEYSDYAITDSDADMSFIFDSYMLNEEDLQLGQLRLLEVDKRIILPTHTHIRIVVTATDVYIVEHYLR